MALSKPLFTILCRDIYCKTLFSTSLWTKYNDVVLTIANTYLLAFTLLCDCTHSDKHPANALLLILFCKTKNQRILTSMYTGKVAVVLILVQYE